MNLLLLAKAFTWDPFSTYDWCERSAHIDQITIKVDTRVSVVNHAFQEGNQSIIFDIQFAVRALLSGLRIINTSERIGYVFGLCLLEIGLADNLILVGASRTVPFPKDIAVARLWFLFILFGFIIRLFVLFGSVSFGAYLV